MDLKVKIKTMVETTDDIPAMPQIWMKIRDMTQHLNISAPGIAKEILKDQGMTTRILKVANSATYAGYNQRVTTVTNAIVLLGFNEVRNVVVGYAVYEMLAKLKKNNHFNFKEFWVHSLATGVAARMLAESVQYRNSEEAFVAGLLHDVGKLVISQLMPKEYDSVLLRIRGGMDNLEAENEILHVDHQVIGAWVAERWHFPEVLVRAVSQHHRCELEERQKSRSRIVDIIAVANEMVHLIFSSGAKNKMKDAMFCQSNAQSLLSISRERWSHIIRNLATNVRSNIEEYNLKDSDIDSLLTTLEEDDCEKLQSEKLYKEMNHELSEKVQELSVLNDFSAALLDVENFKQVQTLLLENIYRGIAFSRILLFVPVKNNRLDATAGFGADIEKCVGKSSIKISEGGVIAKCFSDGTVINVLNAASHLFSDVVSQHELNLLRCSSFACVPLTAKDKVLGVIVVDNHVAEAPVSDQRLSAVVTFCNQASLALKKLI
ncbi:MAG: HDOD domain-containing protein [Calditrichaeota bacterium]|nr:MAG: HDOD domain-containing protein [Calditrichota bacterium]